jgi:hypothetical protein
MKVLQAYPEVDLYWLLNGKGAFPTLSNKTSLPIAQKDTLKTRKSTSAANTTEKQMVIPPGTSAIERIVIFFKDGTFKQYNTPQ